MFINIILYSCAIIGENCKDVNRLNGLSWKCDFDLFVLLCCCCCCGCYCRQLSLTEVVRDVYRFREFAAIYTRRANKNSLRNTFGLEGFPFGKFHSVVL